jgi:hypothetical protein
MGDMDFEGPNPIAGIIGGLARGIQEKQTKAYLSELEEREKLAKQFDAIYNDTQKWDAQSRSQAMQYANQLRMLPPDKKRPKEFLPDKEGKVPALINVTYRQAMQNGPAAPAQPAPPQKPANLEPPPPVNFDSMFSAQGAQPTPPQPGGEQLGPNAISPAPAVGGMPAMPPAPNQFVPPAAPAASGMGAGVPPPPPPPQPEMQSAMMTPEDMARQEARVAEIKNQVMIDGQPKDVRTLNYEKAAADRAQRFFLKGFDAEGNPLPFDKLSPADQARINLTKAQDELADANAELARAKARAVPQEIALAERRIEVARDRATQAHGLYQLIVTKDEYGGIQDVWGVSRKNPSDQIVIQAPDGIRGERTAEVSRPERAEAADLIKAMDDIQSMARALPVMQKYIGPIRGRTVSAILQAKDLDPALHTFFNKAKTLTAARIKQISGAAVSEPEAQRLSAILTNVNSTAGQMMAALQELYEITMRAQQQNIITRNAGKGTVPPPPSVDGKRTISAKTYDDAVARYGKAEVDKKYTRGN